MQTNTLKTFATVSTDVATRTSKKNRSYLAFNAAIKTGPDATQFVKCQVFGNPRFASQLAKGDRIMLVGNTREVETDAHTVVTLVNVSLVRKVARRTKKEAAA
jgi:hypothetical protein